MDNDIYFRPPWTFGKYNPDKHVAIMFNTVGRSEFFFTKESADVIGLVLKNTKGKPISIEDISNEQKISPNSIIHFFEQLKKIGLLHNTPLDNDSIKAFLPKNTETRYLYGNNIEYEPTAELNYVSAANGTDLVFNVMFELTYECSEQCIHCYNHGATRNNFEKNNRKIVNGLTLTEYKQIIDDLCKEGLVTASISGGDPFSNRDAWEIIDYLYKKDIATTIFTNGLSIEHQVERLAKYYPKEIRISLYSGDYKIHDAITRTPGSWAKTMKTIEQLYNYSVPFSLNCPIMKPNLKSYPKVFDIGKKYNAPVIADVQIIDSMDGDVCATKKLRLSPEEMEVVLTDTRVSSNIDIAEQKMKDRNKQIECRAGHGSYCIMPNGEVKPCCTFNYIVGNLRQQNIRTIATNTPYISLDKDQFEDCWKHDYCEFCNFCVANNYNTHKTFYKASENNCFIAKVKHGLMMKKKEGIDILDGLSFDDKLKQFPDYICNNLYREYRKG